MTNSVVGFGRFVALDNIKVFRVQIMVISCVL